MEETAEIQRAITDPAFSNAWVDHVPDSRRVPSPRDFLGYAIGTPDRLTPPDAPLKASIVFVNVQERLTLRKQEV